MGFDIPQEHNFPVCEKGIREIRIKHFEYSIWYKEFPTAVSTAIQPGTTFPKGFV